MCNDVLTLGESMQVQVKSLYHLFSVLTNEKHQCQRVDEVFNVAAQSHKSLCELELSDQWLSMLRTTSQFIFSNQPSIGFLGIKSSKSNDERFRFGYLLVL
jgi:hypothetical protein